MTVTNHGHHWQFRRADIQADWWPSRAKFVINKDFAKGHHVHDWKQAQTQLTIVFGVAADERTDPDA